jgi:predicted 2-oxoglutarate/Fe(II)-dependent dioxygenase YbiX
MKIKHLGNGIVMINNLINRNDIDENELSKITKEQAPQGYSVVDGKIISDGGYEFDEHGKQKAPLRYTEIAEYDITKTLRKAIYLSAVEYCKIFPVATECITGQTDGYLIKYLPGNDMGPHSDCNIPYKPGTLEPLTTSPAFNTLTTSIFINDGYTGGEVRFRTWGISVKPEFGSALLYPSNFIGCHEVDEVKGGERWAFLSWFYHGNGQENKIGSYEWVQQFRSNIGLNNSQQEQVLVGERYSKTND